MIEIKLKKHNLLNTNEWINRILLLDLNNKSFISDFNYSNLKSFLQLNSKKIINHDLKKSYDREREREWKKKLLL